tara:strand:+ start:222 stop:467 length:246 start_codon:yes stop_codon:yes gene_type:complete
MKLRGKKQRKLKTNTMAMQELVRKINNDIDEVFYTDEVGKDHYLERVEHAGNLDLACYVAGQEVPVGYIDVTKLLSDMERG